MKQFQLFSFFFMLLSLFLSSTAAFADATPCISQGKEKKETYWDGPRKYVQNTCSQEVVIAWCSLGSSKKERLCGGEKYYHSSRPLKPGEKYFNQYSLPEDGTLRVVACYGSWSAIGGFDGKGGYTCKGRKPASVKDGLKLSAASKEHLKKFLERVDDIKSSSAMLSAIAQTADITIAVTSHVADNTLSLYMMDEDGVKVRYHLPQNISSITKKQIQKECLNTQAYIARNITKRVNGKKVYTGADQKFWAQTCKAFK